MSTEEITPEPLTIEEKVDRLVILAKQLADLGYAQDRQMKKMYEMIQAIVAKINRMEDDGK